MAKAKQMSESFLAKLIKELNSVGDLIRVRQDEKQSVMDDFEKLRVRYRSGKISESTLRSSTRKTNKELMRLDKGIRDAIVRSRSISDQIKRFTSNQSPRVFRAHVIGVTSAKKSGKKPKKKAASSKRSKKQSKKKSSPKIPGLRAIMRREKALDRRYQK